MKALLAAALLAAGAADSAAQEAETVRLIVGFRQDTPIENRGEILARLGMTPIDDLDPLNVLVAETTRQKFRLNSIQLQSHPQVALVEEDLYINWIMSSPASFAQTEFLATPVADIAKKFTPKKVPGITQEIPWGVSAVNAPAAWNDKDPRSQGGGVKVAVLDTGVDCSHPDLHCTYGDGINIIALDKRQRLDPADDNGHGTHVAGIIAAQRNAFGVVGVAPLVRIVPVKVLDSNGSGRLSQMVKGISWCASQNPPIPIVNISLGTPNNSVFLHSAVTYAKMRGVTLVAAAGNDGGDPTASDYPAAYEEVIPVAAMDIDNTLASFSSRGPRVFVAPGVGILSTLPGGEYGRSLGSSMAVPHISALAAIAVAYGANGPEQVQQRLAAASRLIRAKPRDQGFGLPDATRLVLP